MMVVTMYTWENCPDIIKSLSSTTKHFFDAGGKITLVAVITHDTADKQAVDQIMSHFKDSPTEIVKTVIGGIRTRVDFWSTE